MVEQNNKADCSPSYRSHVYCTNPHCNFDLGVTTAIEAVFEISMNGGYIQYDGANGLETDCPECHENSIVFEI